MPMDIPSKSSYSSPSPSCAFPSWSSRDRESYATSYISDDDLADLLDVSPFAEPESTPLASPNWTPEQQVVVDTAAIREFIAQEKAKKERRARRRGSSSSKKSRSSSGSSKHMSPIKEYYYSRYMNNQASTHGGNVSTWVDRTISPPTVGESSPRPYHAFQQLSMDLTSSAGNLQPSNTVMQHRTQLTVAIFIGCFPLISDILPVCARLGFPNSDGDHYS
ncbi:hypothetical protein B0O99DRAFT_736438 [Bisporella sp. PMI_857]|nr:hypothetical protein B0O99DRAFT_736438 [Bisporella sp. PMI_857]